MRREARQERGRRHRQVEVPDDVHRVVQVDVGRDGAEEQAGQAAERRRRRPCPSANSIGRRRADRAPPDGVEPVHEERSRPAR